MAVPNGFAMEDAVANLHPGQPGILVGFSLKPKSLVFAFLLLDLCKEGTTPG